MASVVDQVSAPNLRVAYRVIVYMFFQCLGGLLVDWLWLFDRLCSFVDILELIEVVVEDVGMIFTLLRV